jgi:hypothetical protein
MYQMDIISMHESTFHCKAFQNISKLFSLVWKYTYHLATLHTYVRR